MSDIESRNEIKLKCESSQALDVIKNVNTYSGWWPKSIKINIVNATKEYIGSIIEVRPYGGKPFYCQIIEINSSYIKIHYSGIYEGSGIWQVVQNENECIVKYEIGLKIVDKMTKILSYVLPIEYIHHKLMEQIMDGLRKYIIKS